MLGLWIWQTPWPMWLRLVLVAGLAWWNVYMFFRIPILSSKFIHLDLSNESR
jgi:hypothetical protein